MATQTIVTCDLHGDGTTQAETVSFGLDGRSFELDLCEVHSASLHQALAPYVEIARDVVRPGRSAPSRRGSSSGGTRRTNTTDIREWARQQGYEISTRGRVPSQIVQEYEAAQGKSGGSGSSGGSGGGGRRRRSS